LRPAISIWVRRADAAWDSAWVEKENLCLYGYANEAWGVALPAEEVPTELPEPALGINFARDGMNRRDWLTLVAVHSDSWLVSVAFYYAARLNRNERYDLRSHPQFRLCFSRSDAFVVAVTFSLSVCCLC